MFLPMNLCFFAHEANRTVISGDWKLVSKGTNKAPYTSNWELFNLKNDRTETKNRAIENPQKTQELKLLWENWAKENNVYTLYGRGWNEKIAADVTKN